jgi:serine/threonine protein kinase
MNPMEARFDTLFLHARELTTPRERAAFPDEVCAGDPELRARLEARLAAEAAAAAYFGDPNTGIESAGQAPGPIEAPGAVIGAYKLLEPIGEGGFGAVWMADQQAPVRRRVALKILKPGLDSKEAIARFDQERQALAMMDHANIAKVFDAGTTHHGRPYFVMELVRGTKITEYADEHELGIPDRVRLFIQVCHAVHHAHQKGIIHRDLKPSNVLVTTTDGVLSSGAGSAPTPHGFPRRGGGPFSHPDGAGNRALAVPPRGGGGKRAGQTQG